MAEKRKIKVLVLMGGPSAEHEVSLHTGAEVLKNLNQEKFAALPVVITKERNWLLPRAANQLFSINPEVHNQNITLPEPAALEKVKNDKPDVVFIAMHGAYGEDGTVQGLLETLETPYTGSGVLASALGMDKPKSGAIFREAGLWVPDFEVITEKEANQKTLAKILKKFSWPLVVKPANHGSSVGISIVKNEGELNRGVEEAFRHARQIILQKFIRGREITCGVLENKNGKLVSLPLIEIIPRKGPFYDYSSKYDEGGSDHIIPPENLTTGQTQEFQRAAALAHNLLGCRGMSRSDFILGEDGKIYILEINTIPGMTSTSLLPQAAKKMGINFPELLEILIERAMRE